MTETLITVGVAAVTFLSGAVVALRKIAPLTENTTDDEVAEVAGRVVAFLAKLVGATTPKELVQPDDEDLADDE